VLRLNRNAVTGDYRNMVLNRVDVSCLQPAIFTAVPDSLTGSLPTEHLEDRAMELNNIGQLYDYNRWANRRILTVASILASDDFIRPMGNSFSSVRDTLAHILSAEWIWLERWRGRSPKALLDAATFPTVQSLKSRWELVEHDQTQFIEALAPQRLDEELAYINQKGRHYSYPLWQQMVHVVNHSSYHRGQVTTLLRQLGREAISTDFLEYYDEKKGRT
jgi:uncharacterized damage-inducible protein DinB